MNQRTKQISLQALTFPVALALFLPTFGTAAIADEATSLKIAKSTKSSASDTSTKEPRSAAGEAVTNLLVSQKEAWNKGDLDNFMSGYLHSEKLSFTSAGNIVWGYEALRARYQKKYGESKETMGKLEFSDLKTYDLGPKNELMIGRWHLDLATTSLDGVFSLVFVNTKDGWRIMHDHTSLAEKRPDSAPDKEKQN